MEKKVEDLIDALKTAFDQVDEFSDHPPGRPKRSIFMSPMRQEILRYLCRYPCVPLASLGSALKMSGIAARWHIKRLVERNFVASSTVGRSRVYYPSDLVLPEHVEILSTLAKRKCRRVFLTILRKPGLAVKELCGEVGLKHQTLLYYLDTLLRLRLIEFTEDGRYTRYYPTNTISELRDCCGKQVNKFRRALLKKLAIDGVAPKLVYSTSRYIQVRLMTGSRATNLVIDTDPFVTILSEK